MLESTYFKRQTSRKIEHEFETNFFFFAKPPHLDFFFLSTTIVFSPKDNVKELEKILGITLDC